MADGSKRGRFCSSGRPIDTSNSQTEDVTHGESSNPKSPLNEISNPTQMSPAKRSVLNLEGAGPMPVEPNEFEVSIVSERWNLIWDYENNCIKKNISGKQKPANYGALFQESLLPKHPGLIYNTARQPRITQSQTKRHVPFAQFWGYCAKKNPDGKLCPTKYKLCINSIPKPQDLIVLIVTRSGDREHCITDQTQPVSRKIKGPIRELFAKNIANASPSTAEGILYRNADPWDLADQVRPIGINVARTLKFEARQANFLSKEMMIDLDKRQQRLAVEFPELPAAGYLQEIGYLPFHLPLFNSMQLHTALKLARERNGLEIHIDATGSILSKLDFFRHKAFLYTVVIEGPNPESSLSIFDFILDMHDWIRIRNRISSYLSYLNACQDNVGPEIRPIMRVTTDFSWALIKAVISSFNNYMSVGTYLNTVYKKTYNIPDDSVHSSNFYRAGHLECIITLCYAHIMKSFSMNLTRKAVQTSSRRAALHFFADLIHCQSHEQFLVVFKNFATTFGSKYDSTQVQSSLQFLKGDIDFDMNEVIDEDRQAWYSEWETELVWEESPTHQKKPLKLFTAFYEDLNRELKVIQDSANVEDIQKTPNEHFSPEILNTFFSIYVPVIPLWAEFCFKFHGNYSTRTNGRSEGMFSFYKTHVFKDSRLAPAELVETLFQTTITSYRKHYGMRLPVFVPDQSGTSNLKGSRKTSKRKPTQETVRSPLDSEKWAKRSGKKSAGYGHHLCKKKGFELHGRWFVLKGNFHQGNTDKFSESQAGSQCTAIAAMAICYAKCNPIQTWLQSDLDQILTLGDQFYTSKLGTKRLGTYLTADEVQGDMVQSISRTFSPGKIRLTISSSSERSGMLLDGLRRFPEMKVLDVLLEEFILSEETGCILTASGFSYSLIKDADFIYFIDSHSRNVKGQQDANGVAIVLKIPSRTAADSVSELLHNLVGNVGDISGLQNSEVVDRYGCQLSPILILIEPITSSETDEVQYNPCPNESDLSSSSDQYCHVCHQVCGGAHKCRVCNNFVHAICGAAVEDEEGFGSLLTCNTCLLKAKDPFTHREVCQVHGGLESGSAEMYQRNFEGPFSDSLDFPIGLEDICSVCASASLESNYCSVCFKFCHRMCCTFDETVQEYICRSCFKGSAFSDSFIEL